MERNGQQIAVAIEKCIGEIAKCRREIEEKGKVKARAIKNYDMKLAIALATLRDGNMYELAGRKYDAPPVSIMEKIAKGLVASEREELELADTGYKACICNLEALQAQLNGYQSIFRHLDSM